LEKIKRKNIEYIMIGIIWCACKVERDEKKEEEEERDALVSLSPPPPPLTPAEV
jgi:hypothetical protein